MSQHSEAIRRANSAEQRWADEVARANALAARVRELEAALRDIIADHDERVTTWGDTETQPHRLEVMENGRAALGSTRRDAP